MNVFNAFRDMFDRPNAAAHNPYLDAKVEQIEHDPDYRAFIRSFESGEPDIKLLEKLIRKAEDDDWKE